MPFSPTEKELSHHSSSSTPLVTDKESQGEKSKLMSAVERLLVEVLSIALSRAWWIQREMFLSFRGL